MPANRKLALVGGLLAVAAACTSFTGASPAPDPLADAGPQSIVEAGDEKRSGSADATSCEDAGTVSIETSLLAPEDLAPFVLVTSGMDASPGYPAADADGGTVLLSGNEPSARSSMWFATPVPLGAFDVAFQLRLSCPQTERSAAAAHAAPVDGERLASRARDLVSVMD
jgi:hypothetical protein